MSSQSQAASIPSPSESTPPVPLASPPPPPPASPPAVPLQMSRASRLSSHIPVRDVSSPYISASKRGMAPKSGTPGAGTDQVSAAVAEPGPKQREDRGLPPPPLLPEVDGDPGFKEKKIVFGAGAPPKPGPAGGSARP